MIINHRTRILF